MMNSIFSFLKFTTETEEDFTDRYIPTLDMNMAMLDDNTITYKLYEKPMGNKYCVGKESAMNEQSKE